MKKNLLLLIAFLLTSFCYSQTLKAILISKSLKGVGDHTELSERAKKPKIYSYLYSNKKSIQKLISDERTTVDTASINKDDHAFQTTRTYKTASSVTYFKNEESKIYKVLYTKESNDVTIKEPLPKFNWKLESENQIISGYNCKKATTTNTYFNSNQKVIAWYCEDIPIDGGPTHYSGLPGFIMQIELDDSVIETFEKLQVSKENTSIEEPKNNAADLSYKEFSAQKNR
ncbi:GLPGLI family protein [Flavobacterium sp. TMP13]|uniref:GLPGLI family protein n=1 Tax=Flavobacterium sp. TMP13 TaxID=3425950 RepID=UPI003D775C13